jgi:transcriptional regulator NrdR family protein
MRNCTCGARLDTVTTVTEDEGRIVKRFKKCPSCQTKFTTYESLSPPEHILEIRKRKREAQKRWLAADPERAKRYYERHRVRQAARDEAKETGEPIHTLYEKYGVPNLTRHYHHDNPQR